MSVGERGWERGSPHVRVLNRGQAALSQLWSGRGGDAVPRRWRRAPLPPGSPFPLLFPLSKQDLPLRHVSGKGEQKEGNGSGPAEVPPAPEDPQRPPVRQAGVLQDSACPSGPGPMVLPGNQTTRQGQTSHSPPGRGPGWPRSKALSGPGAAASGYYGQKDLGGQWRGRAQEHRPRSGVGLAMGRMLPRCRAAPRPGSPRTRSTLSGSCLKAWGGQ